MYSPEKGTQKCAFFFWELKKFARTQKIITERLNFFDYPSFLLEASKNKEYLSNLKFKDWKKKKNVSLHLDATDNLL